MWKDMSGIMHESRPGEFQDMLNQNSGGWPAPRQGQQNQPQATQQTVQQNQQGPLHKVFDIIFVDSREEVDKTTVNPGCDQIFAAKDDSFFAVKSSIGNTSTTTFYGREEPKPAQQPIDMSIYARRDEIPELVSAAFLAMTKQQDG